MYKILTVDQNGLAVDQLLEMMDIIISYWTWGGIQYWQCSDPWIVAATPTQGYPQGSSDWYHLGGVFSGLLLRDWIAAAATPHKTVVKIIN